MAVKKEHQLDIKQVLENADMKNYDWFDGLKDEEKKSFEPFVAMLFLSSGSNNNNHGENLELANEVLNKDFAVTSRNKEFFYRLCCVCGDGKKVYHKFTRPSNKRQQKTTYVERFFTELYEETFKKAEIELLVKKNKDQPVAMWEDYADSLEWSKDDIKKMIQEVKVLKTMF